jgi:hypothetical protein
MNVRAPGAGDDGDQQDDDVAHYVPSLAYCPLDAQTFSRALPIFPSASRGGVERQPAGLEMAD